MSRDKSQAIVFVFSLNSDHWNNLVPRLYLQGLLADAEYEVSEPFPNDITQSTGNYMVIETDGEKTDNCLVPFLNDVIFFRN